MESYGLSLEKLWLQISYNTSVDRLSSEEGNADRMSARAKNMLNNLWATRTKGLNPLWVVQSFCTNALNPLIGGTDTSDAITHLTFACVAQA